MQNWDWEFGKKVIANIDEIKKQFPTIEEFAVSPDGENIAAAAKRDEDEFSLSLNGSTQDDIFEKLWYLRYLPNGKLTGLVRLDDMWTLIVDNEVMEDKFDFAWHPKYSREGDSIAFLYKLDSKYGVSLNGKKWDEGFQSIRDYSISPDGKNTAASVQVDALAEADVDGFFKGTWSTAVNGKAWDNKYINIWNPVFSDDSKIVAAEARTDICDYSIAFNDKIWNSKFGCVWQPVFRKQSDSIIAPVRKNGTWTVAENGEIIWANKYVQLWQIKLSPDGKKAAAITAPEYGKWTIAVDDKPWKLRINEMIPSFCFSPDGEHIAAVVKNDNKYSIALDGKAWQESFDMIWDPVFSPCGKYILTKAEKNGRFVLVCNGRAFGRSFDNLWDPVFDTGGDKILIKYIENGEFCREVISLSETAPK